MKTILTALTLCIAILTMQNLEVQRDFLSLPNADVGTHDSSITKYYKIPILHKKEAGNQKIVF